MKLDIRIMVKFDDNTVIANVVFLELNSASRTLNIITELGEAKTFNNITELEVNNRVIY